MPGKEAMQNLHCQRYLNAYLDFDSLLWAASRETAAAGTSRFLVQEGDGLALEYRRLAWDSAVLGLETARIDNVFFREQADLANLPSLLARLDTLLGKEGVVLASFRFGLQVFPVWHALERAGWYTADVLNIYAGAPSSLRMPSPAATPVVRTPTLAEAMAFFDRDAELFRHARMHRDGTIGADRARRFYRELFASLLRRGSATALSLWEQDVPVALVIGDGDAWLEQAAAFRLGYLWEIMVRPEARGRGLAGSLFSRFLDALPPATALLEVGTQIDNLAANRLYQSAGLRPVGQAVTMHRRWG